MAKSKKRRSPEIDEARIATDPLLWVAQGLVLLKVVAVLLVFDPNASDAFSLPKSAVSHLLTYALAAVLLALLARHGRVLLPPAPLFLGIAAVVLTFSLATLVAADTTVALYGAWRRYLGLTQIVDNAVLAVAAGVVLRTTRSRSRLLAVALAAALLVSAYALVQRLGLDFVQYKEALHPVISTVGQPDILGALAAVAATTALAGALVFWDRLGRGYRAGALLVGAAALVVCVLTGVRAGALGLAAGWAATLVLLALWPRTAWRGVALRAALAAGVLLVVVVALSPIGQRLSPAVLASDLGIRSRLDTWDTAWRVVLAHPVLGVGPDNFGVAYPAMRSEVSALLRTGELQNSTHSWFWYAATSAGVFGAAAYLLLASLALAGGVLLARRGRAEALALVPAAAYLGQGLVGVNDLALDWVLWLCAGVIATAPFLARVDEPEARPARPAPEPSQVAAGLALLIVIAVGLGGVASRIGGSRALAVGQAYVAQHAGSAAVPLLRDVVAGDPRRPEHWANYAAALDAMGSAPAAAQAFLEAARLDPSYPFHWRNLSIELGQIGNLPGAYIAVQRSLAADPYDAESLDLFAELALSRGETERAITAGTESVKIDPTRVTAYDAPVLANLSLGRYAEAERLLVQAFENGADANAVLHYRRAQLYAATSRKNLALKDLDVVLQLDPKNADAAKLKQELAK